MFSKIKRLIKILARRSTISRRDRTASLDAVELASEHGHWRQCIIFLLIIPAVYYLVTFVLFSKPTTYIHYYVPEESPERNKTIKRERFLATTAKKPKIVSDKRKIVNLPVCVISTVWRGLIIRNLTDRRHKYSMVRKGGYYVPLDCQPRHKVSILVPYRNRNKNLVTFIFYIHPFLIRQNLEYRIFVIEQSGKEEFNKGRLYNAGFKEMQKYGEWKCVVFHDVDLLPADDRILYSCPAYPRHMCGAVNERIHDPRFHSLFGGVTSMTLTQYALANGYSNMYWGWGGEDNDMFWRVRSSGFPVVRYNRSIAKYIALPHHIAPENKRRFKLLHTAMERRQDEGLSNVEYKVLSVSLRHLYTHIVVDINPYNDNITALMSLITSRTKAGYIHP